MNSIELSIPADIIRVLSKVHPKPGKDPRNYICGIHFDTQESGILKLVATDGHRIAAQQIEVSEDLYAALAAVDMIKDSKFTVDLSGVKFSAKSGHEALFTLHIAEREVRGQPDPVTRTSVARVEILSNGNLSMVPVTIDVAYPSWRRVLATKPEEPNPVPCVSFNPSLLTPFGDGVRLTFGAQGADGPLMVESRSFPDMQITIMPMRW